MASGQWLVVSGQWRDERRETWDASRVSRLASEMAASVVSRLMSESGLRNNITPNPVTVQEIFGFWLLAAGAASVSEARP